MRLNHSLLDIVCAPYKTRQFLFRFVAEQFFLRSFWLSTTMKTYKYRCVNSTMKIKKKSVYRKKPYKLYARSRLCSYMCSFCVWYNSKGLDRRMQIWFWKCSTFLAVSNAIKQRSVLSSLFIFVLSLAGILNLMHLKWVFWNQRKNLTTFL